ncbi:MAG: triose-phosphate isomerase [Pseudobdellovibrionaceae bacterium]
MRNFLVAGNWKMNGNLERCRELGSRINDELTGDAHSTLAVCEYLVCPPSPYLLPVKAALEGSLVRVGAQDCSAEDEGAHTGDLAVSMLEDIGCRYVILGHSERRADHHEADAEVAAKAAKALAQNIRPVICIGEVLAEREAGKAESVTGGQLHGSLPEGYDGDISEIVIAYEPVWAIGTGKVASPDDVAAMHDFLRAELVKRYGDKGNSVRLLYGGSVKPENAKELAALDNVDGFLIGGASLKAESFIAIGQEATAALKE